MTQHNLSETLFKTLAPKAETTTLIKGERSSVVTKGQWYRDFDALFWLRRDIPLLDAQAVLARIASSNEPRSESGYLDAVIGYRPGNWNYEWVQQGVEYQQRAQQQMQGDDNASKEIAGRLWTQAASCFSIASYPHFREDRQASVAQGLIYRVYKEALSCFDIQLKKIDIPFVGTTKATGWLHLPANGKGPYPTIMVCGELSMLASDYLTLFTRYLAPAGFAMLSFDAATVAGSHKHKLSQDTSALTQATLTVLQSTPWVDHLRVGLFGVEFGANSALRLSYLEPSRIKAMACIAPMLHNAFSSEKDSAPLSPMALDVFASRMGRNHSSQQSLALELAAYSLKRQGLAGRRNAVPQWTAFWDVKGEAKLTKQNEAEARLIYQSAWERELVRISDSPISDNLDNALKNMVNWLEINVSNKR